MANIGKVIVRPVTRTTISSPNFNPKANVALDDISDVDVVSKYDGDVIQYNATTGKFITAPIEQANVNISNIFGGTF